MEFVFPLYVLHPVVYYPLCLQMLYFCSRSFKLFFLYISGILGRQEAFIITQDTSFKLHVYVAVTASKINLSVQKIFPKGNVRKFINKYSKRSS